MPKEILACQKRDKLNVSLQEFIVILAQKNIDPERIEKSIKLACDIFNSNLNNFDNMEYDEKLPEEWICHKNPNLAYCFTGIS